MEIGKIWKKKILITQMYFPIGDDTRQFMYIYLALTFKLETLFASSGSFFFYTAAMILANLVNAFNTKND